MLKVKLGVLASGRGSNLQAIMDEIEKGNLSAEVAVVLCDKADAPALERARQKDIPAFHVNPKEYEGKEDYEKVIVNLLKEHGVDLVVLAGYMRLVGHTILEAYQNRVMNIHPALLPSFPGLHGQRDALTYGVKFSGCTVHFVDTGVDSGPIILQAVVPVLDDDTEETLSKRILEQEHQIYPRAIQLFCDGKLKLDGRKVKLI